MKYDEQKIADKLAELSYIILDTAVHIASITDAMQATQDHIVEMSRVTRELISELPQEIQDKLKSTTPFSKEKGPNALADYLKKLMENGGEDS